MLEIWRPFDKQLFANVMSADTLGSQTWMRAFSMSGIDGKARNFCRLLASPKYCVSALRFCETASKTSWRSALGRESKTSTRPAKTSSAIRTIRLASQRNARLRLDGAQIRFSPDIIMTMIITAYSSASWPLSYHHHRDHHAPSSSSSPSSTSPD